VAQAIIRALDRPVSGAFNIAAPERLTLEAFVRNGRKAMLPVPRAVARAAAGLARRLGSRMDFTYLDVVGMHLTVDCTRARSLLGWTPEFSAWDTRAAVASACRQESAAGRYAA
jgi:nucleoside-diphosphate-sugar epimerase